MKHKNYFEITARDNYDLGLQTGKLFGDITRKSLKERKIKTYWESETRHANKYLSITQQFFPQYIDEIKGYALSSCISFEDLWALMNDVDASNKEPEKCTTFVTNNGETISHNEDWEPNSGNTICILKKTIKHITIFELYYYDTLGGVTVSVNSHGYMVAVNTLHHADIQIGVPRNIIARWLSETKDVEKDYQKIKTIPRANGYNHVFVKNKNVWDMECTACKQVLFKPSLPFVHTNHYLSENLKPFEKTKNLTYTFERYKKVKSLFKDKMSIEEIIKVNSDTSDKSEENIINKRTVGKMIVDLKKNAAKVWLRREKEKDWIDYPLT